MICHNLVSLHIKIIENNFTAVNEDSLLYFFQFVFWTLIYVHPAYQKQSVMYKHLNQ